MNGDPADAALIALSGLLDDALFPGLREAVVRHLGHISRDQSATFLQALQAVEGFIRAVRFDVDPPSSIRLLVDGQPVPRAACPRCIAEWPQYEHRVKGE